MKYFIILTGLLSISTAFAQTKLIAHKRYGGNNSNFKNEWFIGSSNFGMAPEFRVKNARLDSVILLSDKVAVMVTSEVCQTKDYSDRVLDESIWRPGKDTVYNHVLFNGKNNEEEIRYLNLSITSKIHRVKSYLSDLKKTECLRITAQARNLRNKIHCN